MVKTFHKSDLEMFLPSLVGTGERETLRPKTQLLKMKRKKQFLIGESEKKNNGRTDGRVKSHCEGSRLLGPNEKNNQRRVRGAKCTQRHYLKQLGWLMH